MLGRSARNLSSSLIHSSRGILEDVLVQDCEENIWSLMFGIKGKIDATIRMERSIDAIGTQDIP